MANYLQALWQRLLGRQLAVETDVERIAVLRQVAVSRRAEYAKKMEQAPPSTSTSTSGPSPLSVSRKRMLEAEAAHTAALQKWENKQARQKSY